MKQSNSTLIEIFIFLAIAGLVLVAGFWKYFSWASIASVKTWGNSQHIILYSNDGVKIGEWDSEGQIQNETSSDGFHFMDKVTKKQVRVSGTTVTTSQ